MLKNVSPITWFFILLSTAAIMAVTLPPNVATLGMLHISSSIYRAAVLTLILPYAVIWFSAFYAYDKLRQYVAKLHTSAPEKEAFQNIMLGIGIMAWGLAIPTIASLIFNAIAARISSFENTRVVINNYIAVLVPLFSFTILSKGTRRLDDLVATRPSRIGTQLYILTYTTVSVFFVYMIIHNHDTGTNPYHMSMVPLIITLIIPYVYAWSIGLLSAYELWIYARATVGLLYKKALAQLAGGIVIVIAAAITVQSLTSAYASRTSMALSTWLLMIYGLLALQASGYAMIALGAKRLKRMEEV